MALSIYFPQNEPKRFILQFPKQIGNEFYWLVKKPMSMGTIIAVPLHEISLDFLQSKEIPSNFPKTLTFYFRVGRHLHGAVNGLFKVQALPLFQPIKSIKNEQ